MTLPGSGPLTRSQIKTEFGLGSTAIWPNDFFGKGGAPSARPLKFSDFHGRSNAPLFTPAAGTYSSSDSNGDVNLGDYQQVDCTQSVTWYYTITGIGASQCTGSLSTGGSGTSIRFDLNAPTTSTIRHATVNLQTTVLGTTYNWTLNLSATGDGACVTTDSFMLMGDKTQKRVWDLQIGDLVWTQHEKTLEWGQYRISKLALMRENTFYRKNWPTATHDHRFTWPLPTFLLRLLPTSLRWFRAGWFGKAVGIQEIAKITVEDAHTYVARHPESKIWRLCHNIKA